MLNVFTIFNFDLLNKILQMHSPFGSTVTDLARLGIRSQWKENSKSAKVVNTRPTLVITQQLNALFTIS